MQVSIRNQSAEGVAENAGEVMHQAGESSLSPSPAPLCGVEMKSLMASASGAVKVALGMVG